MSPVCPLGTNSAVAPIDPAWVVATTRNTQVVSDSTNVPALECALRRRESLRADPKSPAAVHLATSRRLLRAQRYDRPDLVSHFAAFTLASAGRDTGDLQFELSAALLHIGFYLRALRGYAGPEVPLAVSATAFASPPRTDLLKTQLLSALRRAFPDVVCEIDPDRTSGRGYYRDVCFRIHATTRTGEQAVLVDGGAVNWTQQLLANAKERLVTSGIGSERLCIGFPSAADRSDTS